MALNRVRRSGDDEESLLTVEGAGDLVPDDEGDFIGPLEVGRLASLGSLRDVLRRYARDLGPARVGINPRTGQKVVLSEPPREVTVRLVNVPSDRFSERHSYEFVPEPISLVLREGELLVRTSFVSEGADEPTRAVWEQLLAPVLRRARAEIRAFDTEPEGPIGFRSGYTVTNADFWQVWIDLAVPIRGRSAAPAIDLGEDVLAVVDAAESGQLTSASAYALVEAGRADLLIGQAEHEWLECKRQPYPATDTGRYELAKDVAGLANSPDGGLLLIGLDTSRVAGEDVISRLRPVPVDDRMPDRYRKWLDLRLFPRPVELRVKNARQRGGGCIIAIRVAAQPPALHPFLVKGVLRDQKLAGVHVAIFERRGDAVIHASVEEIHSLLVVGRGALGYGGAGSDAH